MKVSLNNLKKVLACFLTISMLFNPSFALLAFAQEVSSFTISPINEDNFISGDVTVSATITDSETPITGTTFTVSDYYGENEQSCSGEQGGEAGNNWSCQIDTRELSDSNDELYDVTLDYEVENGISNTAYYSDNNNYFDIDNTPPQDPYVGSSSHNLDEPSADNTIDIFQESPDDSGSGVDGFSYSFSQAAEDLPDEEKDIEEDVTQVTSDDLEDGTWYFHLRTRDNAGNWTSTVHLGPFNIDTTVPDAPSATPEPGDYDSNQEVSLLSNDEGSGLLSIYYTTDDTDPSNENGSLYEGPIPVDKSMTIKALAYDNAGNASLISELPYGIIPVVLEETAENTASSSATISETTNNPSTSQPTSQPPSSSSEGSGSTASVPVCSDQKPGSAPTLLSAQAAENSVTLSWSEGQNPISYYLVAYGLTPGTPMFGNPNVGGKGITTFTAQDLSGGTTYYFRVRAGNGCMPGDYSNELSATSLGSFVENPVAKDFSKQVLGTSKAVSQGASNQPTITSVQSLGNIFAFIFNFIAGLFAK